jgi:hypothetical protein
VLGTLLAWLSFVSGLLSFEFGLLSFGSGLHFFNSGLQSFDPDLLSFDSGLLSSLSQIYTTMGRKTRTAIELLKGTTAEGYQIVAYREKDAIREGPKYVKKTLRCSPLS